MSVPSCASGLEPLTSPQPSEADAPHEPGSPSVPAAGSVATEPSAGSHGAAGAEYRADIDGLRALAVLAVVVFHAQPSLLPGGFIGVDIFFVIAGYLISGIIFRELAAGRFTLRSFYTRRIRRLFPALAIVLLAALTLGWFYLLPSELVLLGKHVAASVGFVQNWWLWHEVGYFDPAAETKPLLHLWSLGVEEQFYLIYPLLLAWLSRRGARPLSIITVVGLASFAAELFTQQRSQEAAYFLPHARFWELMVGALVAARATESASLSAHRRNAQSLVGLALAVTGLIVIDHTFAFPGWWAWLPVGGAALLISAGSGAWVNRWLLSQRLLVGIGLISYPLYLWHWVLLTYLRIAEPGGPSPRHLALAVAASFVGAWLTYRGVETPIRGQRTWFARPLPLLALLAGVGGLGLVVVALQGLKGRLPAEVAASAEALNYDPLAGVRSDECWLSKHAPADGFASDCVEPPAANGQAPLIFIWGDSHAGSLTAGLRALQSRRSFRIAQFTRDSCRPLLGVGYGLCKQGNRFVLKELQRTQPDAIVLYSAWDHVEGELAKLNPTLDAIQGITSKPVFVIGPPPQWDPSLPRTVVEHFKQFGTAPDHIVPGLERRVARVDRKMTEQLRDRGVTYISARSVFCNKDGCLTRTGTGPQDFVSYDYGHLTRAGGLYLLEHGLPDTLWGPAR